MNIRLDSLAIGPGLGDKGNSRELLSLLENFENPIILDADALNQLAKANLGDHIRSNMILTPHPGEMERLQPGSKTMSRTEAAHRFASRYSGATLLLKGARSIIAQEGQSMFLNGTGNAGMATGGQGDLLTGVIAGLTAQDMTPMHATRLGAWLCGRAAELAISQGTCAQQSLTASDVGEHLGMAFRDLQ